MPQALPVDEGEGEVSGVKFTFVATAAGMSAYIGAQVGMFWAALLAGMAALVAVTLYDELAR